MRLNGIHAEPGTVIGIEFNTARFLAVEKCDSDGEVHPCSLQLRYATPGELTAIGTREPLSVTEHLGIPKRMTPYGPARMFGPRPYVKPKVINKRQAKEFVRKFNNHYPRLINGQHSG